MWTWKKLRLAGELAAAVRRSVPGMRRRLIAIISAPKHTTGVLRTLRLTRVRFNLGFT
jgi:hypothetical protein